MTDNNNYGASMVGTVTYNAAGQLTQFGTEARSYNTLGQLTNITASGMNLTYNYTAGQNNGKIASQNDAITGETVTYAYDSLKRLISAQSGSTWGQGFQYDGFGNLTAKTVLAGSAPTLSVGVDPSTNRIIGQSYDANGNMGSSPSGMALAYDAENRMTVAQSSSSGMQYAYDEQNKRVWSCPINPSGEQCTGQQIAYFYGLNGKMLAQFNVQYTGPTGMNGNLTPTLTMAGPFTRLYFGSRMLGNEDRLSSRGRYYPYGEDRPPSGQQNPGDGGVTFATYTRDSATGLNYADQRYYATGWGRFESPDPYENSAGPEQPQSWNRFAYSWSDPINMLDPSGLVPCGSSVVVNGGVISVTVNDCIGFLGFIVTTPGLPSLHPVYTVSGWDADHGIAPRCPMVPSLPGNSNPPAQIQANINAVDDVFNSALQLALQSGSEDPGGAGFAAMLTYLAQQFYKGGAWDYKQNFDEGSQNYDFSLALKFGNFNFGAVLAGLGFNYYFTQNAAGAAQIGICITGGKCGVGVPGFVFPYGDQPGDAAEIKKGYDYETSILAGCQQ